MSEVKIDLDKLERIAKAATAGPWEHNPADALFITTLHPTAALELIRLARLGVLMQRYASAGDRAIETAGGPAKAMDYCIALAFWAEIHAVEALELLGKGNRSPGVLAIAREALSKLPTAPRQ